MRITKPIGPPPEAVVRRPTPVASPVGPGSLAHLGLLQKLPPELRADIRKELAPRAKVALAATTRAAFHEGRERVLEDKFTAEAHLVSDSRDLSRFLETLDILAPQRRERPLRALALQLFTIGGTDWDFFSHRTRMALQSNSETPDRFEAAWRPHTQHHFNALPARAWVLSSADDRELYVAAQARRGVSRDATEWRVGDALHPDDARNREGQTTEQRAAELGLFTRRGQNKLSFEQGGDED